MYRTARAQKNMSRAGTSLTLRGTLAPALPADKRHRVRFVLQGRAAIRLWDEVSRVLGTAKKIFEEAKDDEVKAESISGVNPCVWRDRRGNLRQKLPPREAFSLDPPPVLETFVTAGSGSRNRARYAEAAGLVGREIDLGIEVVSYRLKADDGRGLAGATVRLISLAPRIIA